MNRRFVVFFFSVCLVFTLGQGLVEACAKCDVERSCTKTDTGMTCIVKAKGDTTADAVRKCMRNHVEKAPKQEGVTVTFTDVEGGIQVAMSATTPEGIKALQAHSTEGCAKPAKGCDHHAHEGKAHDSHKGCNADCTKDCPHAKAAGEAKAVASKGCCAKAKAEKAAKAEGSKGCAKAKADAKTADCAADCAKKDCPHAKKADCAKADVKTADCAADCAKDCPHAKAAATEKPEGCAKAKAAAASKAEES